MTPQPWFVLAGLLFVLAVIAGAALLVAVGWIGLRVLTMGVMADHQLQPADPEPRPEPAAVLAEMLADLAAYHHQQQSLVGWDEPPAVIDVTAINRHHRGQAGRCLGHGGEGCDLQAGDTILIAGRPDRGPSPHAANRPGGGGSTSAAAVSCCTSPTTPGCANPPTPPHKTSLSDPKRVSPTCVLPSFGVVLRPPAAWLRPEPLRPRLSSGVENWTPLGR